MTATTAVTAVPTVVELVGAGPGDPELLTLRAEAALAAATVVVADHAVAHLAAAFAPRATVTVTSAGGGDPAEGGHGVATVDGDAVRVLAGAARRGERVVRLYRGDPWLHPAYVVESALLTSADVEHVTVPGLAVELAVPTAAGVPVHHRPTSVSVTLGSLSTLPPATDPSRTLVTVTDDPAGLVARLRRGGDPSIPAAVIATDEGPAVVRRGSLADLAPDLAADPTPGSAMVVVVGAVVGAGMAESGHADAEVGHG